MINYRKIVGLILFLYASTLFAGIENPLRPDDAFQLFVHTQQPNQIVVEWQIMPGYHLYKDTIKFKPITPDLALNHFMLPPAVSVQEVQGPREAYENQLRVKLLTQKTITQPFDLLVTYQGCADFGFCYPAMTKKVKLSFNSSLPLSIGTYHPPEPSVSEDTPRSFPTFTQTHPGVMIVSFLMLGLLLSFTPCVFPMVPILMSIISGHGKNINTSKAFKLSLVYVLSSAVIYAIAGVFTALAGSYLQASLEQPWIILASSFIFILLAFSLFGYYELKIPERWQHRITSLSNHQQGGQYLGVAAMGMLSTLIVSPCVTAPLIGVLGFISQTGNAVLGGGALFLMGIGMGIPLLIIGTSCGKLLPKTGLWMQTVQSFCGVCMLAIAVWMLSRLLATFITLLLWGLVLFALTYYLSKRKMIRYLGVGLLFLPLVIDTFMLNKTSGLEFIPVPTLSSFQSALTQARSQHKPTLLDFYADWCASCIKMDKTTFKDPEVKKSLRNVVLLRVDVTINGPDQKELLNYFHVIGPPALIFFDAQGNEVTALRYNGEIKADELIHQIKTLTQDN